MDLEIQPAPSEAEREAIMAAFERLASEREGVRSAWWEAGARENLDADEADAGQGG